MLTISSMSVTYSKEPVVGDTSEVLNYVKIWLNFDLAYFAHEIAILVLIILSKRLISSPTRARKALYIIFQCYSLLWLFRLGIEQIWLPAVLDCHYVRVGSWVYIKISIKIAYFEYWIYYTYGVRLCLGHLASRGRFFLWNEILKIFVYTWNFIKFLAQSIPLSGVGSLEFLFWMLFTWGLNSKGFFLMLVNLFILLFARAFVPVIE